MEALLLALTLALTLTLTLTLTLILLLTLDAAGGNDSSHSGPQRAQILSKQLSFSTAVMNTSILFAVCYTEALGTPSAYCSPNTKLNLNPSPNPN